MKPKVIIVTKGQDSKYYMKIRYGRHEQLIHSCKSDFDDCFCSRLLKIIYKLLGKKSVCTKCYDVIHYKHEQYHYYEPI